MDSFVVHGVRVSLAEAPDSAEHDALVLVTSPGAPEPSALQAFIQEARELDAGLDSNTVVLRCPLVAGGRLVLSPTGALTNYDDVRVLEAAGVAGVRRAAAAGARRPLLALQPHPRFPRADLVTLLAALQALYVSLQVRESFPARAHGVQALGVWAERAPHTLAPLLRQAVALETARGVARDIGGGDPERMSPPRVAEYVRAAFGPAVRVRVLDDPDEIRRQYPLLAAVSRAADKVPRHRGCVIFLEYEPEEYEETVMLVGKGVTYDTGGCDIKAGGAMAGMSRDKCGAAAVVGFFKACELLGARVKAVGALGVVRNSVGSEAYVADELLSTRRGGALRVGNTDAEGRLVMADLLAEMADRALSEKSPHIYTVATLTGHAVRAYGAGYSAALDNHAARDARHAHKLQAVGEELGDMVEISRIRPEDLAAHRGKGDDEIHQADPRPSSALPRGHQGPAAFLLLASGLLAGRTRYTHVDVAASAGELPQPPAAAPLLALAALHKLIQ